LHASISTLNDRLKIAHHAQAPEINLARQVILNCGDPIAGSCGGGSDYGVYIFAHRYGIPDDSCQLYSAEDYQCTPFRNCMNCDPVQGKPAGTCYPVQRYNRYFVTEYSKMAFPSIHEMKAEIFRRGPISCSIDSSFVENGKYHPGDIVNVTGKVWDLDHDISVAGWSVDPDTGAEYWIVRNSWGTFWGDEGWMKVALGHNVMGIESDCAWAVIEGTPVKRNWGPSDVDRMFPSGFEKPDEERNPFTHKRFDFSNYFATGETEGPKKKRSKVSAFSNTTAAVAESLDNSPLWN
jgi:cathepsin X